MILYAISSVFSRKLPACRADYLDSLNNPRVTGSRSGTYSVATIGEEYPRQLEFAYNRYRTPEIIKAEASLLVSDQAKQILQKHSAGVDFLEAKATAAYFVPYEPDDDRHEMYLDMSLILPFDPIDDAIKRYPVSVGNKQYFELAMRRTGKVDPSEFVKKKLVFRKGCPEPETIVAELSPKWIEEYKIYAGECYILEKNLHDELVHLFPSPYYRSTKIEI